MSSEKIIIHLVAAARPNFMKIAPLYHALTNQDWAEPVIVHTGQHYDVSMSDAFFSDLMLPQPHFHLGIGSGTHADQTGGVLIAYEKLLQETHPDMVVVVGDVNSTMACSLAAVKVDFSSNHCMSRIPPSTRLPSTGSEPEYSGGQASAVCSEPGGALRKPFSFCRPLVAHLEAGLRSFDRTMPEEINRVVTDSVADLLWTPSEDADQNLLREGVAKEKIERVGNIMIDSLEMMRAKITQQNTLRRYGLQKDGFGLVTLHRPSNVDSPDSLKAFCDALMHIAGKLPLIFPVHPRTRKNLERFGLLAELKKAPGLYLDQPISYVPFMNLVFNCRLAITDSGGIQEETTYLGIPCLTLRPNTERPVTITQGTNRLCSIDTLSDHVEAALNSKSFKAGVPRLWDGQTAGRIVISIEKALTEFSKNESLRTIRRQVN